MAYPSPLIRYQRLRLCQVLACRHHRRMGDAGRLAKTQARMARLRAAAYGSNGK